MWRARPHALRQPAPADAAGPRRFPPLTESARTAFERLGVRQRRIEYPALRIALPTRMPGHTD